MANWSTLKAAIANVIKTNGNQEITGQVLQNTLNSIISTVGENATYAGIAIPSTNPGAPDGNTFYFAMQPGIYSNFGGVTLTEGLNILLWNGSIWSADNLTKSLLNNINSNMGASMQLIPEYPAFNVIDPDKCEFFKYITSKGEVRNSTIRGYFTVMVKAYKHGLVTDGGSSSFPTYLVVRADGSKRTTPIGEQKYVYEEGDAYVTIGLRQNAIDSLDEKAAIDYIRTHIGAYVGTDIPDKFIPYAIQKETQIELDNLSTQIEDTSAKVAEATSTLAEATSTLAEVDGRLKGIEAAFSETAGSSEMPVEKDSFIGSSYLYGSSSVKIGSGTDTYYVALYPVEKSKKYSIHNDGLRLATSIVAIAFFSGEKPAVGSSGGINIFDSSNYGQDKPCIVDLEYVAPENGYILTTIRKGMFEEYEIKEEETTVIKHLKELDGIEKNMQALQSKLEESLSSSIGLVELEKAIKNITELWMNKTIIFYKKPGVEIDNVVNFDNLMAACNHAMAKANVGNQFEIQVYEDITSSAEGDFTELSDYKGLHALFHVKEYIKIRGMGTMKTIHGELLASNVTGQRVDYETGHFDGGELENLRVTARNIRYPLHFERGGNAVAQNRLGRIRYCDIIHFGGDSGIEGSETSAYKAWDAWGMGSSQGTRLLFEGCNIIGARHGFRCHTNKIFDYPTKVEFHDCTVIGYTGNAFYLDEYGCKCVTEYLIDNCNIQGPIVFTSTSPDSPYVPYGMRICGSGNTTHQYKYIEQVKGLRLQSDSINVACSVVTDDAELFGDKVYRKGENGLRGYVCGLNSNSGTSYNLGKRLGDCSVSPKRLVIKIGDSRHDITFDKDYSDSENEEILQELNSAVSGSGAFDLYDPNVEYYPEFTDVLFYKRNQSGTVINTGDNVMFDGDFDVVKVESADDADAVCVADCGIGETGRFRISK